MSCVKQWESNGMRCAIVRHPNLGHLCGYVEVPPDHALFGVEYDNRVPDSLRHIEATIKNGTAGDRGIVNLFLAALNDGNLYVGDLIDVHGSVTFSGPLKVGAFESPWAWGFDCAHLDDTTERWDEDAVTQETERMAAQIAAIKPQPEGVKA